MTSPPLTRPGAARGSTPGARAEWVVRATVLLDRPMGALGVLFVLVVLGQSLASTSALQTGLAITAWVLWVVFVADFALRWWVSPDRVAFLRRNWWQIPLLAVPALRLVRLAALSRSARAARVLASAVRGSRSARHVVASRVGWLGLVTSIVVLAASQLLYADGVYDSYGEALHRAALATVTGEPLARPEPLADVVEVVLSVYSVVVFATLAGALGAFFLAQHQRDDTRTAVEGARELTSQAKRPAPTPGAASSRPAAPAPSRSRGAGKST